MSQILYINILVDWSLSRIMTSKLVIRESESPRPAASSILILRMTSNSVIIPYWIILSTLIFDARPSIVDTTSRMLMVHSWYSVASSCTYSTLLPLVPQTYADVRVIATSGDWIIYIFVYSQILEPVKMSKYIVDMNYRIGLSVCPLVVYISIFICKAVSGHTQILFLISCI